MQIDLCVPAVSYTMVPASAFNARGRSRKANFQPIDGIKLHGEEFVWSAMGVGNAVLVIDEVGQCIMHPKSGRKQMHSGNASIVYPENVSDA
jgi:hypothetical protein